MNGHDKWGGNFSHDSSGMLCTPSCRGISPGGFWRSPKAIDASVCDPQMQADSHCPAQARQGCIIRPTISPFALVAHFQRMPQYIYIASNPSMPGLIKIGMTTNDAWRRVGELQSTGVPTPFDLELSVAVENGAHSEQTAHRALGRYRVGRKREFLLLMLQRRLRKSCRSSVDTKLNTPTRSIKLRPLSVRCEKKKPIPFSPD